MDAEGGFMIIDLDSHLREGYFFDEVYKLDGPYARFTPVRVGEGLRHLARFIHSLDPGNPQGRAAHSHPYIYDPEVKWRGGEIAERQVGGYDMERRLADIRKEGIEKQIIFPTAINIYWMHRMDDDYEWARDFPHLSGGLTMPPSEYVKRNCYVTCEADEKWLGLALEEFNEDHVMMATDYPHFDSEFPHTVSGIRERSDISAKQKEKIIGHNAARLLRL